MTYNITLTANHQSLTAEYLPLAAESVQYLTAKVVCETEDWTGREIKALFGQGCTVYEIPVTGGEITAKQQLNLTAGDWHVWLVGNSARDGEVIPRITTNIAHISVAPTGGTESNPFPTMPPTVEEQLRADMGNLADLTTEDKSSLVAAINEAAASGGSKDAVTYTPQTLTEAQQAQARTNIGAGQPVFVVNVTSTVDDNYTADKTAAEIEAAYQAGRTIVCRMRWLFGGRAMPVELPLKSYIQEQERFFIFALDQLSGKDISSLIVQISDSGTTLLPQGAAIYEKPAGGIPKSDLEQSVQTSLAKADTSISYDSQTLTDAQKQQARQNIGAGQPDWNQNDSTQPDYIKNRPFYTGNPVETVLVEESTVQFTDIGGVCSGAIESTFSPTVGNAYKVYWDGTDYESACVEVGQDKCIGNLSIDGSGPDTGEPFLMYVTNQGIDVVTLNYASYHTISISRFVPVVVKIDEKYLPDTVATKSEVEAAQTTAENAQTTANAARNTADAAISLGLTAATPGQIIKVKTVQDGKPTEWEAVDMPGGDKWEKIKEITIAEGAEESNALTINADENGNTFRLKKARLCAKFPAYKGTSNIPNFSFAMINGKTTGRVSPLLYTSVWPQISTNKITGTIYYVDVSGAQQIEHAQINGNGSWNDDVTHDYRTYGSAYDILRVIYGDTLWAKPITSIGGVGMLIYPGCHFVLYGVRE